MNNPNKTVIQFRSPTTGVPRGTQLNNTFEIEEQIAQGGMGEIYRGHLIETGDPVAIKMIKPELADNESVLALFRKEASALNELHHDSIVRYYVFALDRAINRRFLAMEFVEGKALSDILRTRALSLEEVDNLRRRMAAGLQVAHDKGIIHRDISPDNIILPQEDVRKAKIIDFGIARSTKLGQQTVIGDGFAGKYNYVSPEQLGLYGGDVTNRSDIYSFGLVLVEALLGKPIDMSGSQADVIDKRRVVPDLSAVDVRIRPLIARMLAPKPEDRPESMTKVAEWVQETTKSPRWSTSAVPGATPASGGSKAPLAAAAGVVALLAAGGGWFLMKGPATPPAPVLQNTASAPPVQPAAPARQTAALPPAELPRSKQGPMGVPERIARIENYVRYYSGGQCLYLSPVQVTDRTASIEALTGAAQAVQLFEEDFRNVNGFAAKVNSARLTAAQCEVVAFLQRADPKPDPALKTEFRLASVKPGDKVQATISGAGERVVEALIVNEDGSVRSVTNLLKRDKGTALLDARIDDLDKTPATQKLLISLVSSGKIDAMSGAGQMAPEILFAAINDEIEKNRLQVSILPRMVRFE